jgi:cold shock CspA family protein
MSILGKCKWFHPKEGYGFITYKDKEANELKDVFVHHSSIITGKDVFKFLRSSEFVEFSITEKEGKMYAMDVKAPDGFMLFCEELPNKSVKSTA